MKTMRQILYAIVAALILAGALSAAPLLVLSEPSFDFGVAPQNSSLAHVFWLYNRGDDTLAIKNVVPGCGCTKAPLEKSVLAAGDSTRLEIIFSTKSYQRRVSKGPRIETNEASPYTTVSITADITLRPDSTYPVVIRPYKLDLSQFGDKVRDRMTFTVTNVSNAPLIPRLVGCPADMLEVTLPGQLEPGASGEAQVRLKGDAVGQSFENSITLQFDGSEPARFTVPVKRTIKSPGSLSAAGGAAE